MRNIFIFIFAFLLLVSSNNSFAKTQDTSTTLNKSKSHLQKHASAKAACEKLPDDKEKENCLNKLEKKNQSTDKNTTK